MIKNRNKKLFAAGACAVGLTLLAPTAAFGDPLTVTGTIDVPAGQRRCIDNPHTAYSNASLTDFVVSGHKVKFIFLVKQTGATSYTEIGDSGPDPVSSYAPSISSGSHPWAFPGTFRTCARNMSEKPSRVTLTVTAD